MENELSFDALQKSATENGLFAHFSCDDFDTIRSEIKEENPNLTERELKEETMFRLLEENLDYGEWNEASWETDGFHDGEHSRRMSKRIAICEKVAHEWVNGNVATLFDAQNLIQSF